MELELLAVTKSGASKGAKKKKKEHFSRCATDVSFRAERI